MHERTDKNTLWQYMPKERKIDFNCVDLDMSDESTYEIESVYIYYHKLKTCCYVDYKHYIKWNRYISISAIICTTAGVVAGGITLNPLILGVISGIGLLLSGIKELLKYEKKAYFAYCEFNKVLCTLRNARRTGVLDKNIFFRNRKKTGRFCHRFCYSNKEFIWKRIQ